MLTPKQKAFADYYIACGNATEAAKRAGYKEKAAYATGSENLRKPQIIAYIAERQKQIDDSRIADAAEVQRFYTAVLRGEVKDQFGLGILSRHPHGCRSGADEAPGTRRGNESRYRRNRYCE